MRVWVVVGLRDQLRLVLARPPEKLQNLVSLTISVATG